MKRLLKLGVRAAAGASALSPLAALAQATSLPSPPFTSPAGAVLVLCTIAGWLFVFLVILAIIFVILAAFNYLTAGGDPEKVKTASSQLIYAAIAVAVGLLARGLPFFVGGIVGGSTFTGCP
jgi:hypothetical protein